MKLCTGKLLIRRILESPSKFFEDQYLDGALQGNIYFGPIKQYADLEKTTGNQVIGDQNEGKIVNNIVAAKVWIRLKGETNPTPYCLGKNANIRLVDGLNDDQLSRIGVSCFTFLSLNDFQEYKKVDNRTYFELKPEVVQQLKQFVKDKEKLSQNSCRIVMFSPDNFFKAFEDQKLAYGLVHYYDQNDPLIFQDIQKEKLPWYFYKSKNYEYQRELRIVSDLTIKNKGEVKKITGLSGVEISQNMLSELVLVIDGFEKLD